MDGQARLPYACTPMGTDGPPSREAAEQARQSSENADTSGEREKVHVQLPVAMASDWSGERHKGKDRSNALRARPISR